jgi:hypothetical protein
MKVHPKDAAIADLVRMTLEKRQQVFEARVGAFQIVEILNVIGQLDLGAQVSRDRRNGRIKRLWNSVIKG